jgi:DNA invertase Pin-like site-specific DNA recombinase
MRSRSRTYDAAMTPPLLNPPPPGGLIPPDGSDKDSDKRQRAAIEAFAKAHAYSVVAEFYDAAVSGADPIADRPGFKSMLERIAGNGVRVILVESPDRFARDLAVQLAGHDFLKSLGSS